MAKIVRIDFRKRVEKACDHKSQDHQSVVFIPSTYRKETEEEFLERILSMPKDDPCYGCSNFFDTF